MSGARRRWWLWGLGALLAALVALVALVAVPILTHHDQGLSHQDPSGQEWPLAASATGDDGRDRSIRVTDEDGGTPDTSALREGDRLVVEGAGYDAGQGIYVAICAIPDDPSIKPGPCLGGVPSQEPEEVVEGTVQYAPSNWINDDWAWKLFGARSYDDPEAGTFTAYLEVPAPADEHVDCREVACGIYTRNDHTAAADRVQDLFVPVGFAG
ncbi:MAG: hypothetical protein KF727_09470 [Microbacteriaceae bacterium]|nr:hypothetical protein [Microbacteriaceae bacterium]